MHACMHMAVMFYYKFRPSLASYLLLKLLFIWMCFNYSYSAKAIIIYAITVARLELNKDTCIQAIMHAEP